MYTIFVLMQDLAVSDIKVNIAENVKRLRKERGWSQRKLAHEIGAHLSHVNRVETGKYVPNIDAIIKLANVFGVPVDYLIRNSLNEIQEVKIENQSFAERIESMNSLDEEDQKMVIRFIDSLLTKKKLLGVLKEIESA